MNVVFQEALDYLRGMWRRRLVGLAASWVVAVAGLVALALAPDKYEASARVFVDTQSVLKPLMSGLAVQPNVEQQVGMLSRTLLSRPNLDKLIRMADLDLDIKTPEQREVLIDRLMKNIEVSGSPGDNLYTIRFRDQNTGRAKRVVDSLLTIFVESGLGGNRRDTQKAQQFIDQQIADYERRLQEAERRLKEFKLRNLSQMGAGESTLSSIAAVEQQLNNARVELRAATQSRDSLKKELAGEEPIFMPDESSPAGRTEVSTELDSRIETLRSNLDELLRKYTEEHPDVVGTKRVIADLEKQRKEMIESRTRATDGAKPGGRKRAASVDRNPVYQQLKLSLAEAEANVASLKGRTDELESKLGQFKSLARMRPELEEELVQLNRDYQAQKTNYDSLVSRRESALMTSQLEQTSAVADFRIIDPPRVSNKPVAPNRLLLLGFIVGVSAGAGLFASLAYSQLFPVFHSLKSLRRALSRPVLGAVAMQDSDSSKRKRRLVNIVFFSGLAGLLTAFGSALVFLLFVAKAG